jgi:hypothetical protein
MNETEKYETIKTLVETKGNKKRAAIKLGCTERTISRQILGYKAQGKSFFEHGNRGRQPVHALSDGAKSDIVDLYRTKYYDANFDFFTELLRTQEDIILSESAVRNTLMKADILSPRATRRTKKRAKQELERRKAEVKAKKAIAEIEARIVAIEDAHSRRPRCANFGEMLQMDAALHPWFGSEKSTLHIAVDDATGMIVGAYFDRQETLNGYYHIFAQILTEYGIPYMFFTDRRTVFEYKLKAESERIVENDTFTQFGYACKQLGVEIKTSSVPQAKGRVERMFETLQGRLPILLRLAGITTLEQANAFLNLYIKEYNAKFALPYDNIPSVFETQPDSDKINLTLAVLTKRTVDSGHSVRFFNKFYRTVDRSGIQTHFLSGTAGLVIKALDGSLFFSVGESVYELQEIPMREAVSHRFSLTPAVKPSKPKYIPPMSHPWRTSSFESFANAQSHRATASA